MTHLMIQCKHNIATMFFEISIILCFLISNSLSLKPGPRIVGGIEVKNRSEFAYQAALYYKGAPFCGGTIIDEKHVLTAAHCCKPEKKYNIIIKPADLTVVVGNLNLYDKTYAKTVQNIFIHEEYDSNSTINDIAVLRITDTFDNTTDKIGAIDLTKDHLTSGNCNVSGWGTTRSSAQEMSTKLLFVEVPIVDWATCNATYFPIQGPLEKNKICAGRKAKDSCQGDSGGPLVCNGRLAGIVSYGYKCGLEMYPGIYTEVAKYTKWVEIQKTRSSSSGTTGGLLLFVLLIFINLC